MGWSIDGKRCLVTGATAGIGRAAALELARQGACIDVICRNRAKGEETMSALRAIRPEAAGEIFVADVSSQQSIRAAAAEVLASNRPIHVLLNNAGVVNMQRLVTADGIESTFAVNHLGYFLLTLLLLDRLKASAPARIVNVASDAHRWGTIDFDDLQAEKKFGWRPIYGRSKLANILFTRELARRLEGSGVTVNCLHPGAVATDLGKQNGTLPRLLISLLRPLFRNVEQGADTAVYLAASAEVDGVNGEYFADRRVRRGSREANDPDVGRRLWELSERLTGMTQRPPMPVIPGQR